ncbi:DNA mismatch repair protein Mlh3-like [Folsomia candida]|uniref:DNA mismatch repair protein Mlh3-like n=1 Tax=Folsomia candida TaxID=158441 RepID=UPI000B8F233D|nr:DNA mismatch repair protein Mlh3-like [Folsomia candida]
MLKLLSKELRDKVRSGCTIVTVAQCVEELVFNSIDAEATKIYVEINLKTFKVEVKDDGCGLSKTDLELIGKRYVTSKLATKEDLQRVKNYGYRGEALASIISVSKSVRIVTRPRRGDVEYIRWFRHDQSPDTGIEEVKNSPKRPPGFTITVEGLLETQPVRQKRLDGSFQLQDVQTTLQHIALINPTINIELRNESSISPLLTYSPCFSHGDAFDKLYSTKKIESFRFVTENHLQDGLLFTATIGREIYRQKCYQFVFVNRKYVEKRMKIHKTMNDLLAQVLTSSDSQKDKSSDKSSSFPVFILNISCCFDKYYPQRDSKFGVAFWDWESCLKGVGGLVLKFQSREFPLSKPVDVGLPLSLRKDIQASQRKSDTNNKQAVITKNTTSCEKSFGHHDITTHDVKNAVHSKRVFREESQETCSQEDSINLNDDDDSQPRKLKLGSNKDLVNSDEIMSTTYSDLVDSPSKFDDQKVLPPRKKSTAKHVTVRRSPRTGREKQLSTNGAPRKDIVVRKIPLPPIKSILNKDVFSKFPQWENKIESQNNAIKRKIGVNRTGATSHLPEKRVKYSSLKYEPRGAANKVLNLVSAQAPDIPSIEPILPGDDYQFDDNEKNGKDWTLKRFISDSQNFNQSHEHASLKSQSFTEHLSKGDEDEEPYSNNSSCPPQSKPRVEVTEASLTSLSLVPDKSTPCNIDVVEEEDINIDNMFAILIIQSARESSFGLDTVADIERGLQSDYFNQEETSINDQDNSNNFSTPLPKLVYAQTDNL